MTARVVFVGAVHEARAALDALLRHPAAEVCGVVTSTASEADRLAGAIDLAAQAERSGIAVHRTDDINGAATVAVLRRWHPDLLVVAGWTRLLKPQVLELPRIGCLGFHASLLPRDRGRAPVNWAIIRGDRVTGNTLMMLDAGTDTGDILDQVAVAIGPDDTCAQVYERVAEAGALMIDRTLAGILGGTAARTPQDPFVGNVLPRRTPDMGVVGWERSPREVHDWVRALTLPYPGAFTRYAGSRIRIWASADPTVDRVTVPPGEIIAMGPGAVVVAVGGGCLTLTEASLDEEAPRPADEVMASLGLGPGSRFDPVDEAELAWAMGLAAQPGPRVAAVDVAGR